MSTATAPATAWPEQLPQHTSASQLTTFTKCAEQYRRKYVLGEKERSGAALILGSGVGKAIEHALTPRLAGADNALATLDATLDACRDGLHQKVEEAGGTSEVAWGDDTYSAVETTALALTKGYHAEVAPRVKPVALEHKVTLNDPRLPVPVIGYLDILEFEQVAEVKTATRAPDRGEPKGEWLMQRWIYQAALQLPLEWMVGTKGQKPRWLTGETNAPLRVEWRADYTDYAVRLIGNRLRQIHAMFLMYGPETPWPDAVEHQYACRYCGFRVDCPWRAFEREAA